jgi:hypothetical protein
VCGEARTDRILLDTTDSPVRVPGLPGWETGFGPPWPVQARPGTLATNVREPPVRLGTGNPGRRPVARDIGVGAVDVVVAWQNTFCRCRVEDEAGDPFFVGTPFEEGWGYGMFWGGRGAHKNYRVVV